MKTQIRSKAALKLNTNKWEKKEFDTSAAANAWMLKNRDVYKLEYLIAHDVDHQTHRKKERFIVFYQELEEN
jgi:hypothetical protein